MKRVPYNHIIEMKRNSQRKNNMNKFISDLLTYEIFYMTFCFVTIIGNPSAKTLNLDLIFSIA